MILTKMTLIKKTITKMTLGKMTLTKLTLTKKTLTKMTLTKMTLTKLTLIKMTLTRMKHGRIEMIAHLLFFWGSFLHISTNVIQPSVIHTNDLAPKNQMPRSVGRFSGKQKGEKIKNLFFKNFLKIQTSLGWYSQAFLRSFLRQMCFILTRST
jgi:hypothetical protein